MLVLSLPVWAIFYMVFYWLLGLNLFLAYQTAEDYLLSLGFML